MEWKPNATVAVVVADDDRFLMVEERSNGQVVYNQPAGHIERNESIFDAARRETLEETGYDITLTSFLGLYTYHSPHNDTIYHRYCFVGEIGHKVSDNLDPDILAAHWFTYEEISQAQEKHRSPMILECIEDYLSGRRLPLDAIREL